MEQVDKKNLTQEQIEDILKEQFDKTQNWQTFFLIVLVAIPIGLLTLWGFGDVHILIRLAVYVVLGLALGSCQTWVIQRRVVKTIEAMRKV